MARNSRVGTICITRARLRLFKRGLFQKFNPRPRVSRLSVGTAGWIEPDRGIWAAATHFACESRAEGRWAHRRRYPPIVQRDGPRITRDDGCCLEVLHHAGISEDAAV